MGDAIEIISSMLDIALGYIEDAALKDAVEKVRAAEHNLLIADADARRMKSSALIKAIVRLDAEKLRFEITYYQIKGAMSQKEIALVEEIIKELDAQRNKLVEEKCSMNSSVTSRFLDNKPEYESVNGISLFSGDVLAVTRKGGLYQHFAIYVGDMKVIHYAAEKGDFSGKISIHEAPFSEFQAGDLMVYVLDFPDEKGHPFYRGAKEAKVSYEDEIYDVVRAQGYHLYSPEETVQRARSRIGEEAYSLPFNNCEHFAIWCKTGVRESHQVNKWLTRIMDMARKVV